MIGRKFSDEKVRNGDWPLKVEKGQNDEPFIVLDLQGETKKLTANEILTMVLSSLKK